MIKRVLAIGLVAFCGLCLPAWAGSGYVGGSYIDTDAEFHSELGNYSSDSNGWKVFGGYTVMKFFAVEASFYDLGGFSEAGEFDSMTSEVQVFDIAAKGVIPVGRRFELFGKLGYSSVDVDLHVTDGEDSVSVSVTDWELLYGVGANMMVGRKFGIRLEWESWDVDTSLDSWSLGAFYRFGGN